MIDRHTVRPGSANVGGGFMPVGADPETTCKGGFFIFQFSSFSRANEKLNFVVRTVAPRAAVGRSYVFRPAPRPGIN
jgi:hypothetical protein